MNQISAEIKLTHFSQLASDVQALSVTDALGFDLAAAAGLSVDNNSPSTHIGNSEAAEDPMGRPKKKSKKRRRNDESFEDMGSPKATTTRQKEQSMSNAAHQEGPHPTSGSSPGNTETINASLPRPDTGHTPLSPIEKLRKILDLSDNIGVRYIEWDAAKTSAWVLLSSSGSFTGVHQDAAGYFTFVTCVTGVKLWCYLKPKDCPGGVNAAMENITKIIQDAEDTETIGDHADPVSLVLTPGTILCDVLSHISWEMTLIQFTFDRIQPAGWLHMVYTLEDSVFTGGHFYMLDGMHLVEATRACAAFTKQAATNASHPGCLRSLCRIALSILFNGVKIGDHFDTLP